MNRPTYKEADRAVRTMFWQDECRYIQDTLDCAGGRVPEMNNDPEVFRRYCAMQRDAASAEGFFDSATYIQECLTDLESKLQREAPHG